MIARIRKWVETRTELWWSNVYLWVAFFWSNQAVGALIDGIKHARHHETWWADAVIGILWSVFAVGNAYRSATWQNRHRVTMMHRDMWLMEQGMLHLRSCEKCQGLYFGLEEEAVEVH